MPFRRMRSLLQGSDDIERGADRLKLELDDGDNDSDLERAYKFLTGPGVREGLLANVVGAYASRHLANTPGETLVEKFLHYVGERYERSNAYWVFLDKLKPTKDINERLTRAEGRWNANIGAGDYIADLTSIVTKEDSLDTAYESLARLAYIVRQSNAKSPEIEAMLAITGKKNLEELAGYEYDQFVKRLESVRDLKKAVAEALAMLAEIVVDLAITIATGGAGLGLLLASLASTVAGMMVREAMLGPYYDFQSKENLQALTIAVAGAGFGHLGAKAFKNIPADQLANLGRAETFLREAGAEAMQSLGTNMTGAMFENKMPSAESIAAGMITIGGKGAGATAKARLTRRINDQMSGVERLRAQVMANVAQQVVGSAVEETGHIVSGGDTNLSAADIALRFGRGIGGGMLRGVGAGVGEHGAERVTANRNRKGKQPGSDDDPNKPVTVTGDDPNVVKPAQIDQEAKKAEELAKIGPVNDETKRMLETNDALRKAFADHPEATRLLKLCHSDCLPKHASKSQLAQLERWLTVMEAAGVPIRDAEHQEALRQWFHRPEHFNDLSHALDKLDARYQSQRFTAQIAKMGELETARTSNRTFEEMLAAVGPDSEAGKRLRAYMTALESKDWKDVTPLEFKHSQAVHTRVFQMATTAIEQQKAFADGICAQLGITGVRVVSILKRDNLDEFVKGVVKKSERNKYTRVSQMDDIIRGRIEVDNAEDVARVFEAISTQGEHAFQQQSSTTPRLVKGTKIVRYPRYHAIVEDAESGLTHEWQIGTKATSELYEAKGIAIPPALESAAAKLGKKFNNDIHDIEYDVFQSINKKHPRISKKYGLPAFIHKVALASDRSAGGVTYTGLPADIKALHEEASVILERLVAGKGAKFVAGFFH
jgi:hypothetical protein